MSIVMQCPYFATDGLSKFCMNGKFPCDCERCSCSDKQYVEITTTTTTGTTTTFGTSGQPNYLKKN